MNRVIKNIFIPVALLVALLPIILIPMGLNHKFNSDEVIVKDDGNSHEGIYGLSAPTYLLDC